MALPHLRIRSVARRHCEAQERHALHDVVLRVLRVLGDDAPEQFNAFGNAAPNVEMPTVVALPMRSK